MNINLVDLFRIAGAIQLCILIASALAPIRLNWTRDLASLPKLHRQMYWTYGGYVVLGILTLGLICLMCAPELVTGSRLSQAVCLYGALFWGIRLGLQLVFEVKPHLTTWWLIGGYHLLTVLFLFITLVYVYALTR